MFNTAAAGRRLWRAGLDIPKAYWKLGRSERSAWIRGEHAKMRAAGYDISAEFPFDEAGRQAAQEWADAVAGTTGVAMAVTEALTL